MVLFTLVKACKGLAQFSLFISLFFCPLFISFFLSYCGYLNCNTFRKSLRDSIINMHKTILIYIPLAQHFKLGKKQSSTSEKKNKKKMSHIHLQLILDSLMYIMISTRLDIFLYHRCYESILV